jgi:TetR/AcrR family transcriptional repressor of nem operon
MQAQDPDSPTRDRLLDAAESLMLSRGFVAATVDGICSAAGLTKGSFFHYFPSKDALGKVLLERFANKQHAAFLQACSSVEDPLERVYCVVDTAIGGARNPEMKGCLTGTFAQEISETHPELRKVCRGTFEGFAEWMGRDLQEAKERHCPEGDFDAESLGAYFLSIAQGSMLLLRTSGERETMVRNLLHFRAYLRSLYGR